MIDPTFFPFPFTPSYPPATRDVFVLGFLSLLHKYIKKIRKKSTNIKKQDKKKKKKTSDSSTEQSDQVNRQSLTPIPAKTEDQLNQEVKKIFADNGYEL
ncbi:hypothetical protein, partial [Enterococcus hirae]|uniref:hypothetical protein n=1 Tax=Enterococcus hirae TaxID=1354 RepID=UPI0025533A19